MTEKMTDELLIARSIEYSAANKSDLFEKDFDTVLITTESSPSLSFDTSLNVAVVHLLGGGALPYKVGSWVITREVKGSFITLAVYKKHR